MTEKIIETDNMGRELPMAKNQCECGNCSCGGNNEETTKQ